VVLQCNTGRQVWCIWLWSNPAGTRSRKDNKVEECGHFKRSGNEGVVLSLFNPLIFQIGELRTLVWSSRHPGKDESGAVRVFSTTEK